jgi:hypothetical protein
VIAYYLLSGIHPFYDQDNQKNIMKNVVNKKVVFDEEKWKNYSNEARSFVDSKLYY